MGRCKVCGKDSSLTSSSLGVCRNCVLNSGEKALAIARSVHEASRARFNLPSKPPRTPNGLYCGLCANNCQIGDEERGFCGLVCNLGNKIRRLGGTPEKGVLTWYYDPLPTNCVSWWFCPGCTGSGYPKHAYTPHAETSYLNLAVFYGSCSLDCLFCQNWNYRQYAARLKLDISVEEEELIVSSESLADQAKDDVSCVCFFGGDPATQMLHSLDTARRAIDKAESENRILRTCWETNGLMNRRFAEKASEYALGSGGNVKIDLKAWNTDLHAVLCGVSNKEALATFRAIGERFFSQRNLPMLSASTLLIPGYVEEEEVGNIAEFVSSVDPDIPYTLLAFHPCYILDDLPRTSRKQARECLRQAEKHLKNVHLGNIDLLI